jgi:acid phosphatase
MQRIVLALLTSSFLACAATAPAPQAAPCNPGLALLNAALWTQSAVEYRAAAMQTYANARLALDRELAANAGGLPPAVILDLDETALDNTPFEGRAIHKGITYDKTLWKEWTAEGAAPAVPGAAEFLAYARSRGVRPFYVTNRDLNEEAGTRRNLEALGFPLDPAVDTLLQRGEQGWQSDKTSRREYVAKTHRVLLLIGDDLNDFVNARDKSLAERDALLAQTAGEWGTRWFILPNPIYGSWETAVTGGTGTACEQLQKKAEALRER